MNKIVLCLLPLILFISSCVERQILDEIGLLQAVGYDLGEEENIDAVFILPIYRADGETVVQKYEASGNTSKSIRRKISAMSEDPIVAGQLRVALYNEELAKKGLLPIIDTLYRDASIGNRMNLSIVRGSVKDILLSDYSDRESVAIYIQKLILHNIKKETLPSQNLHLFLYRLYSDGQDPFMPILVRERDHIKISEIAFFKKDKLVHSIPLRRGFIFKLLLEGYSSGKYELSLPAKGTDKKDFVIIEKLGSSATYYLDKAESKPKFRINIKIKGQINEYSGKLNMAEPKTIKMIQSELQKELEKNSEKLINEFIEHKIDPLGFGSKYRSKTYDWDPKEFKEKLYPKMEVEVNVNVKIISTGVVE
jgi:spore germination protein